MQRVAWVRQRQLILFTIARPHGTAQITDIANLSVRLSVQPPHVGYIYDKTSLPMQYTGILHSPADSSRELYRVDCVNSDVLSCIIIIIIIIITGCILVQDRPGDTNAYIVLGLAHELELIYLYNADNRFFG